ncbi:hypothetical protein Tco_0880717, partial [Tanacetum coccineum]
VKSASHSEPVFLASTIVHSKSASGHDASADSTAEADPRKTAPNDSLSQQQGKTKSARDGLETTPTKTGTEKEANYDQVEFNTSPDFTSSDDAIKDIKLEDLSKLVKDVDGEDEEVHAEAHIETEDTSVPQPSSPKSIKIQELTNQLTELPVQSLKPEISKLLTTHDFSASIPTELKALPSKFSDLNGEFKDLKKYIEGLEIEIPGDLKEIPKKLYAFQFVVLGLTKQVAEMKNQKLEVPTGLLALPGQVSTNIVQLSKLKVMDAIPGRAGPHPAKGGKNTQQATITQLFQRRTAKDATKANLNKEPIPTTSSETTTVIPPTTSPIIIPTTIHLQSPFLSSPLKTTPQPEGELVKNKGKEAMSHEEATEKESESDSETKVGLSGLMVESSKQKSLKNFAFVNE